MPRINHKRRIYLDDMTRKTLVEILKRDVRYWSSAWIIHGRGGAAFAPEYYRLLKVFGLIKEFEMRKEPQAAAVG